MAVSAASVSVGTTATLLSSTDDGLPGESIAVNIPSGGATVYVGGSGVTTSAGFPITAGTSLTIDLESNESLYGVVASGTQAVNVLRRGV